MLVLRKILQMYLMKDPLAKYEILITSFLSSAFANLRADLNVGSIDKFFVLVNLDDDL